MGGATIADIADRTVGAMQAINVGARCVTELPDQDDDQHLVEQLTTGVMTRADITDEAELLSFEKQTDVSEYCGPQAQIQDHPSVIAAVDKFWQSCNVLCERLQFTDESTISEREYKHLHLRVQKAMLPDWNKVEALEIAREEFQEELGK